MKLARSGILALVPLVAICAVACTDRDRTRTGDAGPLGIDSGPADGGACQAELAPCHPDPSAGLLCCGDLQCVASSSDPAPRCVAPPDAGPPMMDAGPPIGSCIGACSAAGAAECPSFDRTACQDQCVTEGNAAEEAGCTMEYRLYLGCRQTAAWSCDTSGNPVTTQCDDERATWEACMGG